MTEPLDDSEKKPKKTTADLGLMADSFVRQGTAPLDRANKSVMDPELGEDFFERQARETKEKGTKAFGGAALHTFTEGTVAKAEALIESLEPRVELLMRACLAARQPIPGVTVGQFRHHVTPNTQKIVVYVTRAIQVKPPLAQRVQVAVFRFHEAVGVVERARSGLAEGELEPGILEELKLKFYYLANYHEEFKIDPVLTQVFPPPQEPAARASVSGPLKGGSGQIQAPSQELLQQRHALEGTYHQAQQIVAELAGHLAFFSRGVEAAEQGKTGNLGTAIFSDAGTKRLLAFAKAVKEDPMLLVKLKGDRKLYDELLARTKDSYRQSQLEPLKETVDAFGRLRASWHQHPVLQAYMAPEPGPKKK
ncbi:MAG: hypothetical protein ACK46X_17575 [Candidatus Sericytochromatia bacterium]